MTATLGAVADIVRGITFKPEDVVVVGAPGVVGCMRTKNVQQALDLQDVWGVPESLVRRPDQILQPGDVLVSSANSWNLIGKCCPIPELPWRATFGGFVSVLRADEKQLDARYLYRWFSSPRTQATVRSFGQQTTNISNLNVDRCRELRIPLPPLAEQRRIADILDRADAMRAKRREAIGLLDGLRQSIFSQMFARRAQSSEWTVKPLASLVRPGDSINYGVVQPGGEVAGGVPMVRVGDIVNGAIERSRLKTISPSIDAQHRRSRLRGDEILVTCVGTIGVTALVKPSDAGLNIARAVARVPVDPSVNRAYLRAYLTTSTVQRYFASELRVVSQPTLNIKQLSETPVPLPDRQMQDSFASLVEVVDQLETAHRASLAEMDGLFASLQHRAFRGEL